MPHDTDMIVVYAGEDAPPNFAKSIFLAGPTPRKPEVPSWRPEALRLLDEVGYDGVVFVPESRDGATRPDYTDQIAWEQKHMGMTDCILFWVPRSIPDMPALTTNVEFGIWLRSAKLVLGAPEEAAHVRYLFSCAEQEFVPTATTLADTVANAIKMVGDGASRYDGECEVPLVIWRTPFFQSWYKALLKAGNVLVNAKVEWIFRVGPTKNFTLFWALHVNIFVGAEGRYKSNEVVVCRPDISAIVLYQRRANPLDTLVVLVKEFRSPGRTRDGFVREVPGGSSFKPDKDPLQTAAEECEQETGLKIDPARFRAVGTRQVGATTSGHCAHLFAAELTDAEIEQLLDQAGQARGVAVETERTYVEVTTLRDILDEPQTDWSNLGMFFVALQQ